MLRVLLVVLLPLVTPLLVYAACIWFLRHRRGPGQAPADWRAAPWAWILVIGLCGSLAGLLYFRYGEGVPPDTKLAPPSVVGGIVVPSHPVD
jgi:hypothetical protein